MYVYVCMYVCTMARTGEALWLGPADAPTRACACTGPPPDIGPNSQVTHLWCDVSVL